MGAKYEKLKESEKTRDAADLAQRKRALTESIEHIDDEDVNFLAGIQSSLCITECWGILGLPPGTANMANHAKKLMARIHPDRVAVDVLKEGIQKRFQLAQHARDMIAKELGEG